MKDLLKKFKWVLNNCKFSLPFIIGLVTISSLSSSLVVKKSLVSKSLIDSATSHNSYGVKKYVIILAILLLTNILLNCLGTIIGSYTNEKLNNKMQNNIYNKVIKSKWYELNKYHSVDLLTRITNDVSQITTVLIDTLPSIISLFVMLIYSFVALVSISKTMALLSLIIFPILILLSKIYGRKLKYFYIKLQEKQSNYSKFIQESFNNILIVKTFCLEKRKQNEIKDIQNDKLKFTMKKCYFSCASNGLLSLSSMIGYFLVLVWGAVKLTKDLTTFGSLTAMLQLFASVQSPIYGLSSSFPKLISAIGAIERITEIESLNHESVENNIVKKNNECSIKFDNVSFAYDKNQKILNNISFNIKAHEIIGLIGPSGEGKTTLIRLILSLLYPTSGNIYINNDNLDVIHRQLISYVPQGNTLFSGTIRDNLSLNNSEITDEIINEALKASCAYDFVYDLKDNLNTIIGEKGIGISEGQAQRLCIARAFLRNAPILILDESTSALDSDTEIKILDSIMKLKNKPTCIIITHRPSALKICDRIIELKNGKIKDKILEMQI